MLIQYRALISQIDSDKPTGACIVALHEGRLVGTLGLRLSAPGGFINSLYVEPEYQGHRIGRQLIQQAADICQEHDKPTLGLAVSDDNLGAQRLYKSLDFLPHEYGNEGYTKYITSLPLLSA